MVVKGPHKGMSDAKAEVISKAEGVPEALEAAMLPGTDADVVEAYSTLAERAKTATFGLFEPEYVVMDTETTGLSFKRDELIEIAAARMNGPAVVDVFQTYVNPGKVIPQEIERLTGITNEMVRGCPSPEEAAEGFAEFAGGATVVAHNASFDRHFVRRRLVSGGLGDWVDTLELSRIALPRMRAHGLDALAEAFGLEVRPTHDAKDDVDALCLVWRILLVALSDMPPGLLELLVGMRPTVSWPLRGVLAHIAEANPSERAFDLRQERTRRVQADKAAARDDAEGLSLAFPTPDEIAAAFEPQGVVGRMYEGFEPRGEQVSMAREVAQALLSSTHRAIEAGTGVGKSVAYLYPAAVAAMRNNITVGISTRTNALMDQLMFHELPLLADALGDDEGHRLRYCALKGYDHYPCLRKLERFASEDAAAGHLSEDDSERQALTMAATLYAFVSQSSWGDLDAVPLYWRDLPRGEIACAPDDCLKNRCRFYPGKCYLHGVRNRASSSDIVVTNHALLFRNITMDSKILPPVRHWVVDEAHSVEQEARRQLSPGISQRDVDYAVEHFAGQHGIISALAKKAQRLDGGDLLLASAGKARASAAEAQVASEIFWEAVGDLANIAERSDYDAVDLWISSEVRESFAWGCVDERGRALHERLAAMCKAVRDLVGTGEQFASELPSEMADLAALASRIYDLQVALGVILDGTNSRYVYAAHLNRRVEARAQALEAELIDVGEALLEAFYPQVHSVIYTSATIATGAAPSADAADTRPFAHFANAVGLEGLSCDAWSALRLESGYDYQNNMTVYVPSDIPAPSEPGYLNALEDAIFAAHEAMGGSVLTLFTNRRDMERVYDDLHDELAARGVEVICQKRGTSAKRLRDQFLDDEGLSLFALRSFWEGFDAPGDTLRCVIVAKLPFGRPTDPLSQERRLRDSRAWSRYSLPEAVIDFKQACGRLIRSSSDTGCLVLPDARLVTKRYGRDFLNALPPARRVIAPMGDVAEQIRASYGRR